MFFLLASIFDRILSRAVNLLLHIERRAGKRIVGELLEVGGYDPQNDRFDLRVCYGANREGVS